MGNVSTLCVKKRTGDTVVSCYLLLRKKDQVCLLLRKNTGFCDGQYGLISGHVETGESATCAMVREVEEEAGLKLDFFQLSVVHVVHRRTERLDIDVFFECTSWKGSVINCEPQKCEHLKFFPLTQLPQNTIAYIDHVIKDVSAGHFYSEMGWDACLVE